MPKGHKPTRRSHAVISLGPHLRLYSEDHFLDALSPLSLSRRGFRLFCKSLSVPMLEIGSTRFIDHLTFALALRSVLRVGQPDFLAPSSTTLRSGSSRKGTTTSLNLDTFRESLTDVITELLAARHLTSVRTDRKTLKAAASTAASRLLLAGYHALPPAEQAKFTRSCRVRAYSRDELPQDLLSPT